MAARAESQEEGPWNPLYPQDRSTLDSFEHEYGFNINPELTEDQKANYYSYYSIINLHLLEIFLIWKFILTTNIR